jgi:hypothetical protein
MKHQFKKQAMALLVLTLVVVMLMEVTLMVMASTPSLECHSSRLCSVI